MFIFELEVERVNNPLVKNHHRKFRVKRMDIKSRDEYGFHFDNLADFDDERWGRLDITNNLSIHFVFDRSSLELLYVEVIDLSVFSTMNKRIEIGKTLEDKFLQKLERYISSKYEVNNIVIGV